MFGILSSKGYVWDWASMDLNLQTSKLFCKGNVWECEFIDIDFQRSKINGGSQINALTNTSIQSQSKCNNKRELSSGNMVSRWVFYHLFLIFNSVACLSHWSLQMMIASLQLLNKGQWPYFKQRWCGMAGFGFIKKSGISIRYDVYLWVSIGFQSSDPLHKVSAESITLSK